MASVLVPPPVPESCVRIGAAVAGITYAAFPGTAGVPPPSVTCAGEAPATTGIVETLLAASTTTAPAASIWRIRRDERTGTGVSVRA